MDTFTVLKYPISIMDYGIPIQGHQMCFQLFRISFETLTGNQLAKPKRGSQCPVLVLAKQKDTSEAERQ